MKKLKMMAFLAGLLAIVFGVYAPQPVNAAAKTLTLHVNVSPDFWNSQIQFPNGNKGQVNGICVVFLADGVPQIMKTIAPGQTDLTCTFTGEEGAHYTLNMPFLSGNGLAIYQESDKLENLGQTLNYHIGMEDLRPLKITTDLN